MNKKLYNEYNIKNKSKENKGDQTISKAAALVYGEKHMM